MGSVLMFTVTVGLLKITFKRQNQSELNLTAVNPQNQKKLTVNRQSYPPPPTPPLTPSFKSYTHLAHQQIVSLTRTYQPIQLLSFHFSFCGVFCTLQTTEGIWDGKSVIAMSQWKGQTSYEDARISIKMVLKRTRISFRSPESVQRKKI